MLSCQLRAGVLLIIFPLRLSSILLSFTESIRAEELELYAEKSVDHHQAAEMKTRACEATIKER